jgi:hypothetical protein
MLAVAGDRGAVLAVSNHGKIIDQDHPDLVLDIDIRRNRETQAGRKNPVHGEFKPRLGRHHEDRSAGGPFVGLDDDTLGMLLQQTKHRFP